MRPLALIAALACTATTAHADDLFPGGKPIEYVAGQALSPSTTVGGYPIYKGSDNAWKIYQLSSNQSDARGNAEAVTVGNVALFQSDANGQVVASMSIGVNLGAAGVNQYWGGSPCGGTHLFALNKAYAQDDNCVTIDASSFQQGTNNLTYLAVRSTQSGRGGRLLVIEVRLLTEYLGFRDTTPADWSLDAIDRVPERKDFLQRVQRWASQLQDASHNALDYKKPADAFDGVPSYRTLLPEVIAKR